MSLSWAGDLATAESTKICQICEFISTKSVNPAVVTAVARKALDQKSGARGLRAILERAMLSLMYELPSRDDVEECVVGEEVIEQGAEPVLGLKREAESA